MLVERFGNALLPLGGKYDYKGVRGKQGKKRDKFQGYTPKKTHLTGLYDSAVGAAVALATLRQELSAGIDSACERKPRAKRGSLICTCALPSAPATLDATADKCLLVSCRCRC